MAAAAFREPDEGFRWFEAFTNLETIAASRDRQLYRLDRMRYLLERAGDPHLACPTIHVAGSKGKGSTAALIAAALREAGIRTGLYTSPHVVSYRERIAVDGEAPGDALLVRLMNEIREMVDTIPPGTLQVSPTPTTFELLTLLAFLVFRATGCRSAVIEVGIGGRLDATNVVLPAVCAIAPIELEHTDILGSTLEEIAREKGGIIKDGVPVRSAAQRPEVRAELERIASERRAPIVFVDDAARLAEVEVTPRGTSVTVQTAEGAVRLDLRMPGRFQAENAALALLTLRALLHPPPLEAIRRGFGRTALPGRMEVMRTGPGYPPCTVVLDGAHTPTSVARAAESFTQMYPAGDGVLLFGSVAGKRAEEMADVLATRFRAVVISRPNPFKESNPEEVFAAFRARNPSTVLERVPEAALRAACAASGGTLPILATGSFYMISEIRGLLAATDADASLGGRIEVTTGDITRLDVDAVVNAANSSLSGGGGVDGAIHRAGGPRILEECRELRRTRFPDGLPAGQAVVTTGGSLSAHHVIHTVGPVYRGGSHGEAQTLASAYRESLARAEEIGAGTVAFPAISTGVYGYPREEAARTALGAIREFLREHAVPKRVMLVFFTAADADLFRSATGLR
jgi:dihydrofolate synthase / folylpolyglutamate synthase